MRAGLAGHPAQIGRSVESLLTQPLARCAPSTIYLIGGGYDVRGAPARPVRIGPKAATIGPMIRFELERVEVLELLGMTLAHLNDAEARAEVSPRVPLLMAIRDKLAVALREET